MLIIAALLALILSNSMLAPWYEYFLHIPVEIRVGALDLDKPLYHWVNDGLMAVFFFLIGLEVKREVLCGKLSTLRQIALPSFAALGGMLLPALIYVYFNRNDAVAMNGWAIPTATDIAFALGVLSLLGKRVPVSLKIFLMSLAILDDLGAIVVIALFYTSDLSVASISVAGVALLILVLLNIGGVMKKSIYFLVGLVLWVSVLKSGVHATLAGVALAFVMPFYAKGAVKSVSPQIDEMQHGLHVWVAFFILPLFAFVNAGVGLAGISWSQMSLGVPMGIMMGLFLGKQLGVFLFSWLAIQLKFATMPEDADWMSLYAVSVLTGIGFTMSLFITSLAFEDAAMFFYTDKLAILIASLTSGLLGYVLLRWATRAKG